MNGGRPDPPPDAGEPPPLFRDWPQLYAAVLAYLVLLIVAFYLFSQAFAA